MVLATALLLAFAYQLFTAGNEAVAQASPPATPTGLSAQSVAHDSMALTWDDPGDGSITGYQVFRRSVDGDEYGDGQGAPEFVPVTDDTASATTAYTDTSVTARIKYVYRIKARNAAGLSGRSTYLNVETPATPATPAPSAPTGLTASSVSSDSVTLAWDAPGDDSITGYRLPGAAATTRRR